MNRKAGSLVLVAFVACALSLCGKLNAYAFYNPTFPFGTSTLYGGLNTKYGGLNTKYNGLNTNLGFMRGMIRPYDFSGLLTGFLGTSILNPIPNIFLGTYLPNKTSFSPILNRTYQADNYNEVIRSSNPVSDFQNHNRMFPGYPINKYGLGDAFLDPLNISTNHVMQYPFSIPWANPLGMSHPLYPVPNSCFGRPYGNGFGMDLPPMPVIDHYLGFGSPSPIVLPPVGHVLPPPDHNSKYYVATTYEELGETIYVLMSDNGEDSQMELQDVLDNGIYCVKVKNISGVQTSYSIHFGESNSTLSLYQDYYSLIYIWAWA